VVWELPCAICVELFTFFLLIVLSAHSTSMLFHVALFSLSIPFFSCNRGEKALLRSIFNTSLDSAITTNHFSPKQVGVG
jgi:hypothetical protein